MDTTRPASRTVALDGKGVLAGAAAFIGLVLLYLLTAPENHALSFDAYWLAGIITEHPITEVPQPRLFLWIAAMQAFYSVAASLVADPDPFRIIGFANSVQAALAVTLFARLLVRDFSVDTRSAWLSAGLLATSYGIWRYATEIEVYATSTLLCVVLLLVAFAVDQGAPKRIWMRILALACLGGVATLVYQPIGFVAGVAIPFYLLIRLGLGRTVLYCIVAGMIVISGFSAAYQLGADARSANAVAFVLDAERVPSARVPDIMTPPKVAYAVGHDLLSTNWSHAFEPFRSLFASAAPAETWEAETFAAQRAGWIVWVSALTLPSAAVFLGALILTAVRRPAKAGYCAREATFGVWLAAHAAMMVIFSPAGYEGWILALVPMIALAARRLIAPAVAAGRTVIVFLLALVFLVHNGLAGIGVLAREDGDYLRIRGQPLIDRSRPGDLIVIGADWQLEQFLRYAGRSTIFRFKKLDVDTAERAEEARREIDATLSKGGRVLVVDDLEWAPERLLANEPALPIEFDSLVRGYLGGDAPRLPTGDAGWFYELAPVDSGL